MNEDNFQKLILDHLNSLRDEIKEVKDDLRVHIQNESADLKEIVELWKSAKGLRKIFVTLAAIISAVVGAFVYIKSHFIIGIK